MYYYRVMGYDIHFSANQLGGPKKVWTIREYGLSQVWVKAEATVRPKNSFVERAYTLFFGCRLISTRAPLLTGSLSSLLAFF
jgi:hypothetical protein